ncbi:hypothetical protein [Yoonia sp.]|uniref:hypothetical protein n=1 Tax=Yoonia sp. TaxID=2212373 RepID=UPI003F6AB2BB
MGVIVMSDDATKQARDTVLDRAEVLIAEVRAVAREMHLAASLAGVSDDGTCPIFFKDEVVHIALPWASVDQLQMTYVSRRMPADPVFMEQILDLVPTLEGKAFLDVGSYTGTFAMFVRRFLKPTSVHLFEPQNVMKDALLKTISANDGASDVRYHQVIIDEDDASHVIGAYSPTKLSEAKYLRREGGTLRARSIDSMAIADVGYINLDFPNAKVNAIRGAMATIEKDRPVLSVDLGARDIKEIRAIIEPLDYEAVRAGRNSIIFVPK